jgi:hypothetical protein
VSKEQDNLVENLNVIQEEWMLEGRHTETTVNQQDKKNLGQEFHLEDEFLLPRPHPV